MKPRREIADYLRDILDAIEKIGRFTAGMDFAQFAGDEKTVFAVIRGLEIVGGGQKRAQGRSGTVPHRALARDDWDP